MQAGHTAGCTGGRPTGLNDTHCRRRTMPHRLEEIDHVRQAVQLPYTRLIDDQGQPPGRTAANDLEHRPVCYPCTRIWQRVPQL